MHRFQRQLFIVILLCATAPAIAQELTRWTGDTGSWFEPDLWTAGVPGRSTVTNIPNGNPFVPAGAGDPFAFELNLARFGQQQQEANAELIVQGQNLFVTRNLTVAEAQFGEAIGKLEIMRNGRIGGDLLANDIRIGIANDKGSFADGLVTVEGNLLVNQPFRRKLEVGINQADNFAHGALHVEGDIGTFNVGFQDITIGHFAGSTGDAVGEVTGRSLRHAGGQINVALNTGSNRTSHANGQLAVNVLEGFEQAFFGISEVGEATAAVDIGEFYGVTETVLGSPNGLGTARLTLGDTAKYVGRSLTVNRRSGVSMGDVMDVEILNAGRALVTNRPDGAPGGIVEIARPFRQTPTGVLDLDIVGPKRGTGYESLQLSDGELNGRVQLNFAKGFEPKAGQIFELITANGQFEVNDIRWSIRNPPQNLAVRFPDANGLVAEFVEPTRQDFINAAGNQFEWTDEAIWTNKQPPRSVEDIMMVNRRAEDQLVATTPKAMVRSLTVDGDSNRMSLLLPRGVSLNATHGIDVKSQGELILDRGTLVANRVELGAGGMLRGQGEIVGKLVTRGLVDVGPEKEPGNLFIDGGFTQLSQGWLEMDVFGVEDGKHDFIDVDGVINLNGTLSLNIPDVDAIGPNARIPLMSATEGIFGNIVLDYENLVGVLPLGLQRSDDGMQMILLSGPGPGILGDMNWDTFVDECDLGDFALALQDEEAYDELRFFPPEHVGDINEDGVFDVDDIEPFFQLVDGVSCQAEGIPEPATGGLFLCGFVFLLVYRKHRVIDHGQ